MAKYAEDLIKQLEAHGFECDGGNLTNSIIWQQLKEYIASNGTGMYGQTPRVEVGSFSICKQSDTTLWLEHETGEGFEAHNDAFAKVLQQFYAENI